MRYGFGGFHVGPRTSFPLVGKYGGGPAYNRLLDPTKPLPMFYDGWALNDLTGRNMLAPTGTGIPNDSQSIPIVEFTVSGSAGSSTLSISAGNQSWGTSTWGAVLQHDDGTYGFYGVTGLGSDVCTVFPNLRADVTAKTLRNVGSSNGQHYSEPGYKALARGLYAARRREAYRNRYAASWHGSTGVKEDWSATGGLGGTQYSIATINNYIGTSATSRAKQAFVSRSRTVIRAGSTSPLTGKGVTKTFSLGGHGGVFEAIVCRADISATATADFFPYALVASVDGVPFFSETSTQNDGLTRHLIDFPAGIVGTVTLTYPDDTASNLFADCVNWWVYDRTPVGFAWTDPLIRKDAKVVVIGDSWTTFYNNVLGSELQQAMVDDGGTGSVVSVGQGGETAEWGLANFDALVAAENPDQVVILFFTNDRNQYGTDGWQQWLDNLYAIGVKCQEIGAEPIFVSPLPTASLTQSMGHGTWGDRLGIGKPI